MSRRGPRQKHRIGATLTQVEQFCRVLAKIRRAQLQIAKLTQGFPENCELPNRREIIHVKR
jgi:hypothetical protein